MDKKKTYYKYNKTVMGAKPVQFIFSSVWNVAVYYLLSYYFHLQSGYLSLLFSLLGA